MRWTRTVPHGEFKATVQMAELIVAHAGMGSFFVAMEAQKPIVVLPRMSARQEHTTDHQLHTLKWLREKPGVYAADLTKICRARSNSPGEKWLDSTNSIAMRQRRLLRSCDKQC